MPSACEFAIEYASSGARRSIYDTWDNVYERAQRHEPLYEVLRGACRCLYLDVEWTGSRDDAVLHAIVRDAETALARSSEPRSALRTHLFESCRGGDRPKASYHAHIVLRGKPFASPPDVGRFVRAHLLPKWAAQVDVAPYHATQYWRLPLATKKSEPARPMRALDGSCVSREQFCDCRISAAASGDTQAPALPRSPADNTLACPPGLLAFAHEAVRGVLEHAVHEVPQQPGVWVVPCSQRECPYAGREHRGNKLYLVVDVHCLTYRLKCFSSHCQRDREFPIQQLPRATARAMQRAAQSDALRDQPLKPGDTLTQPPACVRDVAYDVSFTSARDKRVLWMNNDDG